MKQRKITFCSLAVSFFIFALSSCMVNQKQPTENDRARADVRLTNATIFLPVSRAGFEQAFTNASATMWVPISSVRIIDGHTSLVDIDETTFPSAHVKDYKIEVEIQIIDTPREIKQMEQWSNTDWYFKDHSELSTREVQYGVQIRRDIWNSSRSRRLLINGMIKKSATFKEDIETAKKMIQSVNIVGGHAAIDSPPAKIN